MACQKVRRSPTTPKMAHSAFSNVYHPTLIGLKSVPVLQPLRYPPQTSDDPTVPMRRTADPCPYTTHTTLLHDEYYTKHSTLEVDKIVCNVCCLFIGMCTLVFSVSTKQMYKLQYVQFCKYIPIPCSIPRSITTSTTNPYICSQSPHASPPTTNTTTEPPRPHYPPPCTTPHHSPAPPTDTTPQPYPHP